MKQDAASASSEPPEKPVAVPAAADTAGKEGGVRLSQKFVDYMLAWKPETTEDPDEYYARMIKDPAFSREYVERRTETQRDLAALFKRCADLIGEFKAWVTAEYEEKGYVEVDDDFIAQGIRQSQELEEDEEEFPEAFGPMDGLISDETPQSVIDEIDGRVSEST